MITVNIVEDIPEIRNSIQQHLEQVSDLNCLHTFASAEAALGGILLQRPDVVLMDIGLPKMSGIECMLKIKAQYPEIKFLMFTVFDTDEKVFEALKAGADGYILKREPIPKIIAALREICTGGAPMSKSIALKVLHSFHVEKPTVTPIETLSNRQAEILEKLSKGMPYKLIAGQLKISIGTVKQHIHQIYKKLQVNNKTEAINKYLGRDFD
ncbi:MAG: response regulator [Saprospiraceae bacterium]